MGNNFCNKIILTVAIKKIRLIRPIYTALTKTIITFLIILSGASFTFGQNPIANFTANVTSGCAPLTVTFTDQSTGNPASWNWEFSNGTLSNIQNPIVTFSVPGTYSVKLVVQNANGIAELERINFITVFPTPLPDFTSNISLGCVPSIVTFTDQSTSSGSITRWEWDFGDGGTSNQQNPTHTFTNTGFYSITLAITSNNGCRTVITKGSYIRVVGNITTDFSFTQPSTCRGPFTIAFQNQSSGPGNISYAWDFGNGQTSTSQNPSAVYNAPGSYNVTLNSQSDLGCRGSIQKTITIATTTTDFSVPVICLNQPVTFQNSSTPPPLSSSWDFGDGSTSAQINPIKTFLVPGNFIMTLTNRYAHCTDFITKTISVTDRPIVDFIGNNGDTSSCSIPFNVQFTDRSPGAVSWQWDFGDGTSSNLQNPVHQYTNFGDHTVGLTITTATGCSNTLVKTEYILVRPTTVLLNLPLGGCIPYLYSPSATIQTTDPVISYAWNFGNGITSTSQNPGPVNYSVEGTYTVSLTVTTQSGCITTTTGLVRTGILPVVDFTFTPPNACANTTISFAGTATNTTPGSLVEWFWDFDDDSTSNEQDPQHVFGDTGILNVELTVSNNFCRNSIIKPLLVRPPIARFDFVYDCTTRQVSFDNTSLTPTVTSTFEWNFGNGLTSTDENPLPVLYEPGVYDITLQVTSGGCLFSTTQPLIIPNEPADFTINRNPVCKNEIFALTAITSNAANIRNYSWNIEGTVLSDHTRSVSYSLPDTGNYDVTLTLTDINGCITTRTIPDFIRVNGPVAEFTPAAIGACLNKNINFTDLSTPATGIRSWNFNFGDGASQNYTGGPFNHTYSKPGGYTVSLTVTDVAGCTDVFTLPYSLLVTDPKVGFMADTFYCPQANLPFLDTSSGVGPFTYLWTFGDGNTSTDQHPTNRYPPGDADYTVKLKITDISGCEDSVSKTNYIKIRSPKAAFDIRDTSTICLPLNTFFIFKGTDYQSHVWDFGDGGTSTQANPNHFYGNAGHFIPTLTLTGPGGCIDTATASVTVYDPNAFARINYGPVTTQCNSLNVDFNLVVPPGFKFIFYFGDGSADSTGRKSFSHFYSQPSLNQPLMVIQDTAAGCLAIIYGSPRIDVLGAIPLFGIDRKEFCDAGTVTFKDFTTKNEAIISTVWRFGDGATSNAQDPTHFYTQPGLYPINLEITTVSNCTSSYSDTVRVYRTPVPSIISRDTICVNTPEPFNGTIAQADTLTNWRWDFGNGQASNQQNNTITFSAAGNYSLQLTTTNKIGCSDTDTKNIYVSPLPTATALQDPLTIISGASANLLMNYTGNIVSYNWMPPTRLSCLDCAAPVANPQFTTKYTVQLEDIYGCRNSGDITVTVVCNTKNFFIPNTFSPNGDGMNEMFYPRGTGLFRIKSMTIFNRWGQVVFDRKDMPVNNPSVGWNGVFGGQKASADVYVYMIEILCDNNVVIPIKGNVTLLR